MPLLEISNMNKKLIVIAGNLAVGKTTLANILGKSQNWFIGHESVIDNPYLVDYYSDMKQWALQLQFYFLGNRLNLHNTAYNHPVTAILDRSIYEDAEIFVKALYKSNILRERDYKSYLTIYNYLIGSLPKPNLLIHIKAPIDIILQRIKERGQPFDKNLDKSYLSMIDNQYDEWIESFNLCPLITIDSSKLNYRDNNNDLELIIGNISKIINL